MKKLIAKKLRSIANRLDPKTRKMGVRRGKKQLQSRIKKYIASGKTIDDLAKISGCSWQTIHSLIRDERTPNPITIKKINSALRTKKDSKEKLELKPVLPRVTIQERIKKSGLNQYEVAERAGVSQATVSKLMRGLKVKSSSIYKIQKVVA